MSTRAESRRQQRQRAQMRENAIALFYDRDPRPFDRVLPPLGCSPDGEGCAEDVEFILPLTNPRQQLFNARRVG